MNVEVVIGANYGDEGKGLFTDYLCVNRKNPLVVLSNGGSQRGHTVEVDGQRKPEDRIVKYRRVFHHLGSGTLRGAPTYFAPTFLLNPMQFVKEYTELTNEGFEPKAFRHKDCILQLPCDIALNWHIEKSRGEQRHGSVGCGIWETKYRMYNNSSITLDEFCEMDYKKQIQYIKNEAYRYRIVRCREERLNDKADIYDLFMSDGFLDHFISDCLFMKNVCRRATLEDVVECDDIETLVFENGQGLKLDQFYGSANEANTTPSFTGSIGVAKLLNEYTVDQEYQICKVTLNYISRTYLTKHGAGDFKEQVEFGYDHPTFIDKTNIYNQWQEDLRFAKLDYNQLFQRCNDDLEMFKKTYIKDSIIARNFVMTHANEMYIPDDILKYIGFVSKTKYSADIIDLRNTPSTSLQNV